MNERLGRSGFQEGTALFAVALTTAGAFGLKSEDAYSRGNAEYLTMPLALAVSLVMFLVVISAMKRRGADNLNALIDASAPHIKMPLSAALALLLVYAAFSSLSQFITALHSLFFEGVGYEKIILFVMPTVFFITLMGFETLARTAKVYAIPLVIMLAASLAGSFGEFRVYRLYPLIGGAGSVAVKTMERVGLLFPAFLSLIITADGVNGLDNAKHVGVVSTAAAVLLLFISYFSLSLVYTYKELDRLFMPLFRINYLNKFEAHLMRMDKLAHLIWMNGGMLSAALYIYCSARVFMHGFSSRDIRPSLAFSAMMTALFLLLETSDGTQAAVGGVIAFMNRYGVIIFSAPAVLLAALSPKGRKRCAND